MTPGPGQAVLADTSVWIDHLRRGNEALAAGLEAGMVVMHDAFGPGRIIQITGRGDEAHAVVEFRSAGRKNLMLKYANLRKM